MTVTLDPNVIVTFTGRTINPLDPNPEDINIVDIAHALSNQCRFTGHTKEFYSVAQHSVLVADMVPTPDKLWGLLHDATEAYLADIARPIKRNAGAFSEAYAAAERGLMNAIADKFYLTQNAYSYDSFEIPKSVKEADNLILKAEMKVLMPPLCSEDVEIFPLASSEIDELVEAVESTWTPKNAKANFLIRFAELTDDDMEID